MTLDTGIEAKIDPPKSRRVMSAVLCVPEVTAHLVEHCGNRIKELLASGMNQTEVAQQLLADGLPETVYRTFDVLRSATSSAVRELLPPEQVAALRQEAWRRSLGQNATPEGRAKGLRARNELHGIHGAKLWSPEEVERLQYHASVHVWPEGTRYAGAVQWSLVEAAMHKEPGLPRRPANAYKQRFSILMTQRVDAEVTPPRSDDTGVPPQRAAV